MSKLGLGRGLNELMADRKANRSEPSSSSSSSSSVSPNEGLNTDVVSAGLRTLLVASRDENAPAKRLASVDTSPIPGGPNSTDRIHPGAATVAHADEHADAASVPAPGADTDAAWSSPVPRVLAGASARRLSFALAAADVALLVMLYVLVGRMEAQPSLCGWILITAGVALAAWLGCLAAAQARGTGGGGR